MTTAHRDKPDRLDAALACADMIEAVQNGYLETAISLSGEHAVPLEEVWGSRRRRYRRRGRQPHIPRERSPGCPRLRHRPRAERAPHDLDGTAGPGSVPSCGTHHQLLQQIRPGAQDIERQAPGHRPARGARRPAGGRAFQMRRRGLQRVLVGPDGLGTAPAAARAPIRIAATVPCRTGRREPRPDGP